MDREDEEGEIANDREDEVEEDVEKGLQNNQIKTKRCWE